MMQRPYRLAHPREPSYGAYVVPSPYIGTVLCPSYGASAAPLSSPPYHTHPQYLAYVPATHYSLPSPRHHPVTVPIGPRQSSIPWWQHSANIPAWQNHAYIPSRQRRANIPPRQRRAYMPIMRGDPTPLSYADRVQPEPLEDEVMIDYPPPQVPETDNATQGGGTPAAEHVLKSLPYVVLPLDDDETECVICMEKMCMQDEKEITKMPCDHLFHRKCIVRWLSSNNTCPLCRFKLPID